MQLLFFGLRPRWLLHAELLAEFGLHVGAGEAAAPAAPLVLGSREGVWHVVLEFAVPAPSVEAPSRWVSGRQLGNKSFGQADVAICGQALAMLQWHADSGFSGKTGRATAPIEGGAKRQAARGDRAYPRIDPAVIMAILSADGSRCLLGKYPGGLFTCLAGFVEQGESVEEACRRETFEEAGVRVDRVLLHSTQPWPIGRAGACELMIGCMARAASDEVSCDTGELAAAEWFSREQVGAMLARAERGDAPTEDAPVVPGSLAMAHHLLCCFAHGGFSFESAAAAEPAPRL